MVLCKKCESEIYKEDQYVKCVSCSSYFHADTKKNNCAEITASEEKVIILKSTPKLLYRCNECTISSKVNDGFIDMMKKFNESVLQLNTATENLNKYNDELKIIKDEQVKISSQLPEIQDRLKILEYKQVNSSVNVNVHEVIEEINLRKIKEKNVMIYNMHDHNDAHKDLEYIKNFLSNNNIKVNNLKINRIGNFNKESKRPIKIIFKTRFEIFKLLRKSKQFSSQSKNKIFITNDKTFAQQKMEKEVRSELKSRIDNGENNLRIKYFNSIPKIIEIINTDTENENTNSEEE